MTSVLGRVPELDGARLKVERARQHLKELSGAIVAGRDKTYGVVRKIEGDDQVFRVYLDREVGTKWGIAIGDIVHNLRSALDHIAWQLVIKNRVAPRLAARNSRLSLIPSTGLVRACRR